MAAIFLVWMLIASAPPSRGQTPPPSTPAPGLGSAILHELDNTTGPERPTRDGTFNPIDTKTDKARNRNNKEEMIVIDAAARAKEKELAKKKPHDTTFEASIMDVAVDGIRVGGPGPNPKPAVTPALSPIPSAAPNPLPTALPSLNSGPSNGSSLPLELVPIPKRSEASEKEPAASPTASPHN